MKLPRAVLVTLGLTLASLPIGRASAEEAVPPAPSFEAPPRSDELWDPPVVTPSGQAMRVSEAPSTTFVLTGDEIRRMGATSLPEILRRVPGLDVRQLAATDGQIGPRGFAYDHADRVLVLIDGRMASIDFSGGTAYEMLPVSLIDIDRIEIAMGPGAAVYGNRAMLGVVNIITRSAQDYPWMEGRLDAGNPGEARLGMRWGMLSGPWRLRVSALGRRLTLFEDPETGFDTGRANVAGGGTVQLGYSPAPNREVLFETALMSGRTTIMPTGTTLVPFDATLAHGRIIGRYGLGGPGSPNGELHFQAGWSSNYISSRHFVRAGNAFDATFHAPFGEFSHALRFRLWDVPMEGRWGTAFRINTLTSSITSKETTLVNLALFAHNTVILGRWRLGAGLRVDRQTLTHVNISPRVSLVFSPVYGHQLRLALNTGYNNPNLLQTFADLNVGAHLHGNRNLRAERIVYGEFGYAGALGPFIRTFVNVFVYRMEDWISLDAANPIAPGEYRYGNNRSLNGLGGETGLDLGTRQINGYVHYALVRLHSRYADPYNVENFGSPRHKVGAGLRLSLPADLYLTCDGQYFDRTEVATIPGDTPVPTLYQPTRIGSFLTVQARIGWTSPAGLDLSLAGTNLAQDRTRQFAGTEAPELRLMFTVGYYR